MHTPDTTLLTLNIAHGRGASLYQGFHSEKRLRANLLKIANYIKMQKADIVCLQEVDADSHWNKRLNLLQILSEETGLPHAFHGIHNRREGKRPLAYGNAILSRYPVHFWEHNAFGEATLGEKGFLYAEVDIGSEHLPLINLHLDYRSRKRRILQVEQIIDYMSKRAKEHPEIAPPIVCGDFNTHSKRVGDAVAHLFTYVLSHREYHLYPNNARTFPAYFPSRALDFIFLPEPLKVIDCHVGREIISDHCPVSLRFRAP